MSTSRAMPRRVIPRALVRMAGAVALLALPLPVLAADGGPSDGAPATRPNWLHHTVRLDLSYGIDLDGTRRPLNESRFLHSHWLPKVNTTLGRVGAGDLATYPGRPLHEEIYYDDISDRAYRSMHRATSRALKEYLLEETGVSDLLSGVGRAVERSKLGRISQKAVGIDFGISHMAPEISLKPRLAEGLLRISVRTNGSLGLQYRTSRLGRGSRIGAKMNPVDQKYTLNFLLDF